MRPTAVKSLVSVLLTATLVIGFPVIDVGPDQTQNTTTNSINEPQAVTANGPGVFARPPPKVDTVVVTLPHELERKGRILTTSNGTFEGASTVSENGNGIDSYGPHKERAVESEQLPSSGGRSHEMIASGLRNGNTGHPRAGSVSGSGPESEILTSSQNALREAVAKEEGPKSLPAVTESTSELDLTKDSKTSTTSTEQPREAKENKTESDSTLNQFYPLLDEDVVPDSVPFAVANDSQGFYSLFADDSPTKEEDYAGGGGGGAGDADDDLVPEDRAKQQGDGAAAAAGAGAAAGAPLKDS